MHPFTRAFLLPLPLLLPLLLPLPLPLPLPLSLPLSSASVLLLVFSPLLVLTAWEQATMVPLMKP